MSSSQHNGIWRIKPSTDENVDKVWGLYRDGKEIANREEEGLSNLVKNCHGWFNENPKHDHRNTDSVYLLLPWEFME